MVSKILSVAGLALFAAIIGVYVAFVFIIPPEQSVPAIRQPDPKPAGVNHSVEFYIENADARAAMLERCELIDAAQMEANCINAENAASKLKNKREIEEANKLYGQ